MLQKYLIVQNTGTYCTHLFYSLLNILGQNILTVLTAKYIGVKCTPSTNHQIIKTCTFSYSEIQSKSTAVQKPRAMYIYVLARDLQQRKTLFKVTRSYRRCGVWINEANLQLLGLVSQCVLGSN